MPTRRDVHALLLAAAASTLPRSTAQAATDLPEASGRDVVLNSLTFGATVEDREKLQANGLAEWLAQQLAQAPEDDDLKARLRAARLLIEYAAGQDDQKNTWPARKEQLAYQYLDISGDALVPLADWRPGNGMDWEERIRPAREVQAAVLIRAVHGKAQLREVMTQFWHDHFNVNAMRDEHTAAHFAVYDKTLRAHAFGNFRQLLGAVTKSPAMLYYLNNDASRASPANENFARELFELHTFGAMNYLNSTVTHWSDVPGARDGLAHGYIDQDVYEAARALTGWSVGDGRWLAEGDTAPRTGAFHYIDRWHDPYQKRILGVEFRANAGPMEDGEKLLDLLSNHAATADSICLKICRRLVADEPDPALVDRAVAAWIKAQDAPDQIAQVISAIVLAPEFVAVPPTKIKRPFEFLASLYRGLGAEVASPGLNYLWMLSRAGWRQHECRPPTGHPDLSEHWATTALISTYVDVALNALEEWTATARLDFGSLVHTQNVASTYQAIMHQLTGQDIPDDAAREMANLLTGDAEAGIPEAPEHRDWLLKGLVASAAMTPQFLFR